MTAETIIFFILGIVISFFVKKTFNKLNEQVRINIEFKRGLFTVKRDYIFPRMPLLPNKTNSVDVQPLLTSGTLVALKGPIYGNKFKVIIFIDNVQVEVHFDIREIDPPYHKNSVLLCRIDNIVDSRAMTYTHTIFSPRWCYFLDVKATKLEYLSPDEVYKKTENIITFTQGVAFN